MTWAVHISIASTWFDPAEHPGTITPMMTYYALHDALVKPMPSGEPGAGPIPGFAYTGPYEDPRIRRRP